MATKSTERLSKDHICCKLFTGTAESFWLMAFAANAVPDSLQEFRNIMRAAFIHSDSVRRARDKIRTFHEEHSIAPYLSEFRNVAPSITGVSMDEILLD